jgi:hypothetical protein
VKRLALPVFAFALVALLTSSSALAKGASEATITGPGLGDGITLAGEGQAGGEQLMQIADHAGFFAAMVSGGTQTARPAGRLGPRYVIAYTLPGPNNESDVIRQDLYPYAELDSYAEPTPVTYMKPGQWFWGIDETVGGWWIANPSLKGALVAAGLPEHDPTIGGPEGRSWGLVLGVAMTASLCAVGLVLTVTRRRSSPAQE